MRSLYFVTGASHFRIWFFAISLTEVKVCTTTEVFYLQLRNLVLGSYHSSATEGAKSCIPVLPTLDV